MGFLRHGLDMRGAGRSAFAAACLALALCGEAQSAQYPSRPVRVFVPYGPGGVGDLTVRLLAQTLR